jgi:hypothetical protein
MSAVEPGPTRAAVAEPELQQVATELPPTPAVDSVTSQARDATSLANEFDTMVPELRPGGTIVLGEEEFQLPRSMEPGIECKVKPLRTRHVLLIGRILLGDARPLDLGELIAPFMAAETDDERETAVIAGITEVMMTVPHSEREFIQFIGTIVQTVGDIDVETQRQFYQYLNDPSILDTIKVIHQMVTNERKNLRSLGEALKVMFPGINLTTPAKGGEVAST